MVTATSNGYEFDEIIPVAASSCQIDPGSNISVNQSLVGFIHTHPYKHEDEITDPNCPRVQQYGPFEYDGNVVSPGDKAFIEAVNAYSQIPPTPMYVIDKDKIRVIQPSNPSQYSQTFNRCGY